MSSSISFSGADPTSPSSPISLSFSSIPSSALLSLLERACAEYDGTRSVASESFLVAFQRSSLPYAHCVHVLAHSSVDRAQFTALRTLKDASLREWRLLDASTRRSSRDAVFTLLTAASLSPHTHSEALHVLVLLIKRQWADDPDEAWNYTRSVLHQLMAAPPPSSLPLSSTLLVDLVRHLLCEFAVWDTAALGVSMQAHLSCHVSFERAALLQLFGLCVSLLHAADRSEKPTRQLPACLRALEAALTWEFDIDFNKTLQALALDHGDRANYTARVIHPPVEWREALTQSQLVEQLVLAYRGADGAESAGLRLSALSCLTQLAAVKGAVFTSQALQTHICSVIAACSAVLHERRLDDAAVDGLTALLCRLWDVHGPHVLAAAAFDVWLRCVHELTLWIVHSAQFASFHFTSDTSTGLPESLDQLLATWASLAMAREGDLTSSSPSTTSSSPSIDPILVHRAHALIEEAGQQVFSAYVERRLLRQRRPGRAERKDDDGGDEEVKEEDEQFAGEDNEDEHLTHLAFLGRVHPPRSLPVFQAVLARLIAQYAAGVEEGLTSSSEAVHELAERLMFLLRLLQAVLTDRDEEDVPTLMAKGLSSEDQRRSVQGAVGEVVRFLAILSRAVEAGRSPLLSPLLATAALQLMSRFLPVYLLGPSSPSRPTGHLSADFAEAVPGTVGTSCLSFLVGWPGEEDVHRAALLVLSQLCQSELTRPAVLSSAAYQHMTRLFIESAAASPSSSSPSSASSSSMTALDNLDGASLSVLVGIFLANSSGDAARATVLAPIERRFAAVMDPTAFASASYREDPRTVVRVSASLRMLCGVVEATRDVRFEELFSFLSSLYPHLLELLRAYLDVSAASSVVLTVLQFFNDTAAQQMSYMSRAQSALFLHAVTQLIHLWLSAWRARLAPLTHTASPSSTPAERRDADSALTSGDTEAEVHAVLALLSRIVDADLQSAGPDNSMRAADVCLLALTTMASDGRFLHALPSLNAELPFHSFLQETLTTHTGRFGELPKEARDGVVRLLLHVLSSQRRAELLRLALSCVHAMAAFHCKHAGGKQADASTVFGAYLPQFLHGLFHVLLYQHLEAGAMDVLSDALLPCIIACPSAYVDIGRAVIGRYVAQHSDRASADGQRELERLETGFMALCTGNGLQQSLSMSNKQTFRKNLRQFIQTVRVLVQIK